MKQLMSLFETYPQKLTEYTLMCERLDRQKLCAYIDREKRLCESLAWLGKTVNITMDRPIGTRHPKHPEIIYPINYGYIPGVIGGDGEELDVYLYGADTPLNTAVCTVAGIIHRLDDNEDKLFAIIGGTGENIPTAKEMRDICHFQEQFHSSQIIRFRDRAVYEGDNFSWQD